MVFQEERRYVSDGSRLPLVEHAAQVLLNFTVAGGGKICTTVAPEVGGGPRLRVLIHLCAPERFRHVLNGTECLPKYCVLSCCLCSPLGPLAVPHLDCREARNFSSRAVDSG